MPFRSFFIFFFAVSTILSSSVHARTQEVRQQVGDRATSISTAVPQPTDRQPVGERATPEQKQESIETDVRQPIGTREKPSKPKASKTKDRQLIGERAAPAKQQQPIVADVRQPIGTREEPSKPKRVPQPVDRPVLQAATRQQIGERAAPIQQRQPIVADVRQPIGTRETYSMPNRAPQRIERPAQPVTTTVQIVQRPVIRARPLPQVILIDRRSESYSTAALTPHLISRKGDFIQLDDGSSWKVRHKDQKRVKRWNQEDLIVIETGQYFTWSIYKLVNYTRNESCDVELVEPTRNGLLSHWITEIHPYEGYLRLQDGSVWRMDTSELLTWNVNDDVIIGLSKDWFSSHYSYILINPRAKTRLLATFNLSF